jgi:hypothetical protein
MPQPECVPPKTLVPYRILEINWYNMNTTLLNFSPQKERDIRPDVNITRITVAGKDAR